MLLLRRRSSARKKSKALAPPAAPAAAAVVAAAFHSAFHWTKPSLTDGRYCSSVQVWQGVKVSGTALTRNRTIVVLSAPPRRTPVERPLSLSLFLSFSACQASSPVDVRALTMRESRASLYPDEQQYGPSYSIYFAVKAAARWGCLERPRPSASRDMYVS